uniref:Uncharacterized protein n=1 Tax=Melopsittacus undulatus TaxID=13146 RepID=A0A8V5G2S9_MELUD
MWWEHWLPPKGLLHKEGLLYSRCILNRPYPPEQPHPLPLTPGFLGFLLFIASVWYKEHPGKGRGRFGPHFGTDRARAGAPFPILR